MLAQATAVREKAPVSRPPKRSHLKAVCMFCAKPVYAQSVCRSHYQKAKRLRIPTGKLLELAGREPKQKLSSTVSPRISAACEERLKKAVAQGRAESIYKLAANILEAWRDPQDTTK